LGTAALHCGFDDFSIWFGGEGAGSTLATGTGCSSDSVEVDLVGLGSFVVDNRVYAFDI
tara:strand:+ start:1882 stop:2058 length:177 start_codon:yes stop_codon:yes gene_type:complete